MSSEVHINLSLKQSPKDFDNFDYQTDTKFGVITNSEIHYDGILQENTLILTNVNGFWKQEDLNWFSKKVDSTNECKSPTQYCSSLSDDISSDEPDQKLQPLLRRYASSSIEDSESDVESRTNTVDNLKCNKLKNLKFESKFRPQWSRGLSKGQLAQLAFARKKDELVRQKRQNSKPSKGLSNQQNVDCREPWLLGELVWARLLWPENLPWWPAIVVEKPRKRRIAHPGSMACYGPNLDKVPSFRICLLGPIRPLSILNVPQTRLRLFTGRDEFELFMRQTVIQAKNKVRALRQFSIQPSLQSSWHLARESAEAAKSIKPNPLNRLSLFPWAIESKYSRLDSIGKPFKQNDNKSIREPKRAHSMGAGSSSDESGSCDQSDSDYGSVVTKTIRGAISIVHRKRSKLANNFQDVCFVLR